MSPSVPSTPSASARVTLVAGASGGSGSSLAAGAIALAWRRGGGAVWLVELDVGRGDRGDAWGLAHDRTLDDLSGVVNELGADHLARAACSNGTGVMVLLAPSRPGTAAMWDRGAIGSLLAAARVAAGPGGRVVVDGGSAVSPVCDAAWGEADEVVVVCGATLSAARRARHIIESRSSTPPGPRCGLVLSRGPGTPEIGARALARVVGAPVFGELPWSPREGESLAAGLWPRWRRRSLAGAIEALAEELS